MDVPGAGMTAARGVVMVTEPGAPLRIGLAGALECPEADEFPPPVVKPRKPWATALDANTETAMNTVTGTLSIIRPPNAYSS